MRGSFMTISIGHLMKNEILWNVHNWWIFHLVKQSWLKLLKENNSCASKFEICLLNFTCFLQRLNDQSIIVSCYQPCHKIPFGYGSFLYHGDHWHIKNRCIHLSRTLSLPPDFTFHLISIWRILSDVTLMPYNGRWR